MTQRRAKKAGLLTQLEAYLNLAGKQEIGIGTFAEVFKVYDKRDQTHKALRQLEKGKQTLEEIQQEREINEKLMKINHPNILKVFEIFEDQELICYLTQYCEGGSLWDTLNFIKGKRFTQREAVQIILETSKAVQVLHSHGITHRDLKPQNILFVEEFQHGKKFHIKLADFGLSTNKMLMETIAGTKEYIAPEQIRKDKYTKAVDIWALGIIFDELIHGVPFFTGDSHQQTFHMIVNKDFRVRNEGISSETKELLVKMIKRYPGQRPKIQEVIHKLEEITQVLSNTLSHKSQKGSTTGRKLSEGFADMDIDDQSQIYCSKHPDQMLLRKRKTKQYSCAKCIDEDTNIISIEEYLKIISEQNQLKKEQILNLPDLAPFAPHTLSGICKNDKILKQLQQRKQFMFQNFTKLKQKYGFLNIQTIGDDQIELLQKCSDEIKETKEQFSKSLTNYNDLMIAALDSKVSKFLDNFFKDI